MPNWRPWRRPDSSFQRLEDDDQLSTKQSSKPKFNALKMGLRSRHRISVSDSRLGYAMRDALSPKIATFIV